ncbi:hypothetical protein ACHAW5_004677 [Stephanodiscus triporus]|uniref:Oxidation resistance protein 1 n=1 Tax=Stephanodiscus triporus TaxID=2934178 RepID=A0ABD3NNE2_9STRA
MQAKTLTMASGLPPPPRSSSSSSSDNNIDSGNYGPVTRLAQIAGAREEEARTARRHAERATVEAAAKVAGETAFAIAAAASSRTSSTPFSTGLGGGKRTTTTTRPPATSPRDATKMSVAARARAAADLPTTPRRGDGGDDRLGTPPPAGVSRGKFSPQQVMAVLDRWGRDTDDDDEDIDTSDTASDGGGAGQAEEEGFHYQHHRVSAYANAAAASAGNAECGAVQAPPSQPRLEDDDDDDDDWGLGLFASARSWLQSQRDRLHQLELERQVKDQRRKLVEEGRKQRALAAKRRGWVAEEENASHRRTVARHRIEEDELIYSPEQAAMPYFMCGFGGVGLSDQRAGVIDELADFSGVARVDSSGNVVEMIPSGSHDESCDDNDDANQIRTAYDIKVSSPRLTRSGEGMSVKVDYSDFTDNACVIDNGNAPLFEQEKGREGVDADSLSFGTEIKIVPEPELSGISLAPPVLQPSHMKSFISSGALPPSLNFCKWKRLYSLARDGDSFDQFLRLVEGHDRTVLVVLTTHGRLFGGYAATRWEARHTRRSASDFYGSAQACLFRFPNYGPAAGGGGSGSDEDTIIVYKWSGINRYIQLCDASKRVLAFGGGGDDGYFGLCIEDDFRRGTTGHCSTFENEALCEEGYFDSLRSDLLMDDDGMLIVKDDP